MKKVTMVALCVSVLVSASLNAMMDIENGFCGMNRDIVFELAKIMKNDDEKVRAVFGMCGENFLWKKHRFFQETRWSVFPNALDVKEINEKLENHFAPLNGGYRDGEDLSSFNAVGYDCSLVFRGLFFSYSMDWVYKNERRVELILDMSADACLDECTRPGFKELHLQEQNLYKKELFDIHLYGHKWSGQEGGRYSLPQINVNRLQRLPYDLFLLVLAEPPLSRRYARLFSKNQFRWIPIQCIKKGNFDIIQSLCNNKDKLPKRHLVALDKRIDVLLKQWGVARNHAADDNDSLKASDSSRMLDKVRQLREKFPKSCF
ncbi:hypothetical protein FACS1894122_03240 [Alphaproteobacteria bacterium]|nr:hypothetical protein FACS1894122_03240 [Alphaproteobacteria bacterium]